ncbi:hypothetical protein [Salinicola halophyticus]|nr:hypothetical protein [Salinicola halophyticus]
MQHHEVADATDREPDEDEREACNAPDTTMRSDESHQYWKMNEPTSEA